MKITIWTATVDEDNGLFTSVHLSEAEAIQSVLDAYDPDGEFTGKPVTETPDDDLQAVMDGRHLVVHIEPTTIDVPVWTVAREDDDDVDYFGARAFGTKAEADEDARVFVEGDPDAERHALVERN